MTVKIENHLNSKMYSFFINRKIKRYLKHIPQSHLLGLGKITIENSLHGEGKKGAAVYNRKFGNNAASIEIAFDAIYPGISKIQLFLPFFGNFILASTLYHEIGHHHHHSFQHGVNKKKSEAYADRYKKEMLDRALCGWKMILRPVAPLFRFIAKIIK